jgi:predicted nucleic acid-binding protein
MPFAILDTSVYVSHWEGSLEEHALSELHKNFIVRQSSVVLSELRRGARTMRARRLVDGLRRLAKLPWNPTAADWWEAARIIQKLGDAHEWERRKRQEFQNDALIALAGRRYGATIITTNRSDFALLARELHIQVLLLEASE